MAEEVKTEENKPTIMEMTAFKDLTRQIIEANGDQGKITSLLVQLEDAYNTVFAEHTAMSKEYETVTTENSKLKEYNLELYMQRGSSTQTKEGVGTGSLDNSGKTPEQIRAETITPEDLFNKEE